MNKLIFIFSILTFGFCAELSDFQMYLPQNYRAAGENYKNKEIMIQYSKPEIRLNNNGNSNYELSSAFDELTMQHLPINERNLQSDYFNTPNADTFQIVNQNSGFPNTQNYYQNPSTETKSLVVQKSEQIPTDFLSNQNGNYRNLENVDIASNPETKFNDIQSLIKEFLQRSYLDTKHNPNIEMKNNKESEIIHSGSYQHNMNLNFPTIFEHNSNSITDQSNKLASNPTLSNPHLNFEMTTTQPQTEFYNPSTFVYNNQNFPQNNPSRTHLKQFMMKPTHEIPNTKYEIPLVNNNNLVNTQIMHEPQIQYTNDFNSRIHPQVSTYTNRIPKYFNPQHSKSKVTTEIYAYAAPDETDEEIKDEQLKENPQRKNYKIIFIRAPHQVNRNSLKLIQKQAQRDEKTVIYVLSKKADPLQIQEALDSVQKQENKPEVHFIKYKTDEEAILAQHKIKAQYDNVEGNEDVLNRVISPPPANYPVMNENRNYLPPI